MSGHEEAGIGTGRITLLVSDDAGGQRLRQVARTTRPIERDVAVITARQRFVRIDGRVRLRSSLGNRSGHRHKISCGNGLYKTTLPFSHRHSFFSLASDRSVRIPVTLT